MRALAASHCSLDSSAELSSTSKPASSRARSVGPAPNKNNLAPSSTTTTIVARRASSTTRAAPARAPAPTASSKYPPSVLDSKYAALTDALASSRPRAIRPALNQQQPATTRSARPSIRSASDSLSPHLPSTTTTARRNSITSRRTSTSPKPSAARASASASRSTSTSSATSASGRSASATRRTSTGVSTARPIAQGSTATAATTASAARTRRSLGANTSTTPATTHEPRGRRNSVVSAAPTASTHLVVPGSATGPLSAPRQNGALHTPASAGLVKQAPDASSHTPTNMPLDRTSQGSAASRPAIVPTLSASAVRAANRVPLMPKVAGAKGPQTPTLATPAMSTPTARRMHQPTKSGSVHHYNDLDSLAHDATSPFPGTHVTPRSGTRQVRVNSTNTTPTGTPNTDRHDGWDPLPGAAAHASSVEQPRFRRSNTSFSSTPDSPSASDSKFFHASDIKAPAARVAVSSTKPQTKPANFFYANGGSVPPSQTPATQSTPSLGQTPPADAQSKFLYANGVPELRPSPPLSRGSSSATSSVQPKQTSRPSSGSQVGGFAVQRPQSPIKHASQPQQLTSKIQSMQATSAPRSHVTSPQPGQGPRSAMRRTSSGTSSRVGGHSRAGSMVSGDHVIATHRFTSPQMSPHFATEPVSPLHAPPTPAPLTLASIIQAAQDIEEEEDDEIAEISETGSEVDPLSEAVQSPTKSSHSADPISELVANARRERKVQDLQITNASLEAINRTLERQLKKQTAEIRRFKRMSRTGRISLASAGNQDDSELPEGDQVMDLSLTDLSEEDSEHDDLEDASDSDSESTSESLSPSVIAEKDARHRKKDEKRLRLDLTKHQEILVDSQKLNQSILRCMSWTEELIKEGQKALDYNVRVGEINTRGRVLDFLDDDSHKPGHGLLRDSEIDAHLAELDDIAADLDLPSQDRDSGVSVATKA